MRQGDPQWIDGAMEKWGNEIFNAPVLQRSNTPIMATRRIRRRPRSKYAFALYEVLLGVAIFALGVISLGRAVQNCLNASTISAQENVVRQILSDRMAQVQAAQEVPDAEKEFKINTSYGRVILTQKAAAAALTEPDNTIITGINLVTLTARWVHTGVPQSKQIQFYIYRSGS
jgi:Tfp pilus assembly protein PilV